MIRFGVDCIYVLVSAKLRFEKENFTKKICKTVHLSLIFTRKQIFTSLFKTS